MWPTRPPAARIASTTPRDSRIWTSRSAVPICGGGDPRHGKVIAESGVPIWNFHGTADRDVLIRESRGVVEAIRAAGGRVGHTELPDVGHDAWSHAYGPNGAIDWMFAQRRPAAEATPAR